MPEPANTLDTTLRVLRIICAFIVMGALILLGAAEKFSHGEPIHVRGLLGASILLCVSIVWTAAFLRQKMVAPAIEQLRVRPDDKNAILSFRQGSLVSILFGESILLFGVALRLMGATRTQAAPFYLAGIFLMLVWWPRRP